MGIEPPVSCVAKTATDAGGNGGRRTAGRSAWQRVAGIHGLRTGPTKGLFLVRTEPIAKLSPVRIATAPAFAPARRSEHTVGVVRRVRKLSSARTEASCGFPLSKKDTWHITGLAHSGDGGSTRPAPDRSAFWPTRVRRGRVGRCSVMNAFNSRWVRAAASGAPGHAPPRPEKIRARSAWALLAAVRTHCRPLTR